MKGWTRACVRLVGDCEPNSNIPIHLDKDTLKRIYESKYLKDCAAWGQNGMRGSYASFTKAWAIESKTSPKFSFREHKGTTSICDICAFIRTDSAGEEHVP
jgi:hypothetical protein